MGEADRLHPVSHTEPRRLLAALTLTLSCARFLILHRTQKVKKKKKEKKKPGGEAPSLSVVLEPSDVV